MTYACFDATRNAGIARIMHMSYRSKTYIWNNVILVKRSMFFVCLVPRSSIQGAIPLQLGTYAVIHRVAAWYIARHTESIFHPQSQQSNYCKSFITYKKPASVASNTVHISPKVQLTLSYGKVSKH
jgi:hypothetical protein